MVQLPGCRRERELRRWSILELSRRSGASWTSCRKADAGLAVYPATADKIISALEAQPVSAVARSVFSSALENNIAAGAVV